MTTCPMCGATVVSSRCENCGEEFPNDSRDRSLLFDAVVHVFLGVVSFVFVALPLEPSRDATRPEERITRAYDEVHTLSDEWRRPLPAGLVELVQTDPWDEPYRALTINGKLRVVSGGGNLRMNEHNPESDDIYSGMPGTMWSAPPISPLKPHQDRRDRQANFAYGVALVAWIVNANLFLWYRHRKFRRLSETVEAPVRTRLP